MKRQIFTLIIACILLGAPAAFAQQCFENFPAGEDVAEESEVEAGVAEPDGKPFASLSVTGRFVVERGDPMKSPDGGCQIPTRIAEMDLSGVLTLPDGTEIPVRVINQPERQSRGLIKQTVPGLDFPADSFFDVFVEVQFPEMPEMEPLFNREPARVTATITGIPPEEDYAEMSLRLFGRRSGQRRADLIDPIHRPFFQ